MKKIYAWWGNEIETGARAKRIIFGLMSAYFLSVFMIIALIEIAFIVYYLPGRVERIIEVFIYLLPSIWLTTVALWDSIIGIDIFPRLYLLVIPLDMLALVMLPFLVYCPVIWFSLRPNRRTCFCMAIIMLIWRACIF